MLGGRNEEGSLGGAAGLEAAGDGDGGGGGGVAESSRSSWRCLGVSVKKRGSGVVRTQFLAKVGCGRCENTIKGIRGGIVNGRLSVVPEGGSGSMSSQW